MKYITRIIIALLLLILISLCVFSNVIFYTPKGYADKSVSIIISNVNDFFKEMRSSSNKNIDFLFLKDNSDYTADFSIDKKYAYENNLPYFDSLSISLKTFTDNTGTFNSLAISNKNKSIIEADAYVGEDSSIIAIPAVSDSYYSSEMDYIEYDNDNEAFRTPSLLESILTQSELNPDELGDYVTGFCSNFLNYLPNDCYCVSIGAFNKSDITISVKEPELKKALMDTLNQNRDNRTQQKIFLSSFVSDEDPNYNESFDSFLKGLSDVETSPDNIYTLHIKTNIFGKMQKTDLSCIVENHYKSITTSFSRNKIVINYADNSKFEDEVKAYSEKKIEIIYGTRIDGSIKGHVQYTENDGNALIYFDNLKFGEEGIYGNIDLMITSDKKVSIQFNTAEEDIILSYCEENSPLVSMHGYRTECTSAPFSVVDIKNGTAIYNLDEFTENTLSSEKLSELTEYFQIDKFDSWLSSLQQKYAQ